MPTYPTRRQLLLFGVGGLGLAAARPQAGPPLPRPRRLLGPPSPGAWVEGVSCMAFGTPGELDALADMGAQVMHTNLGWPYYPLRRDGGRGLPDADRDGLRELGRKCRARGVRLCLGLPPFMPLNLARSRPDWREQRSPAPAAPVAPAGNDLGTRAGCNLGPWGDYLIELCAEMAADYQLDGYSFDGNYHPPICYCPACIKAYRDDRGRDLPVKINLDDVAYREYLVWRGRRLVGHYRRLRERLRQVRPGAAVMTWTVNAGRYGHFLHSPRAMPVELNRVIDLPMQEWWLDETNQGASLAPSFGAAYLRAVAGDGPCASEPYLMTRGNPYSSDSFPHHERLTRALLALTYGNVGAHSIGFAGHRETTREVFAAVKARQEWMRGAKSLPWAGLLVSEPTRQFVAYADIAGRFLPHVFGAFRACVEEHLPVTLLTDADVTAALARYAVLILPGAVALSDTQVRAVAAFVRRGGGLVATGETSLCDELGRPRRDFALAGLFGVSYRGRPAAPARRPELDPNFAVAIDADYWRQRVGVARLTWGGEQHQHPILRDPALRRLVPGNATIFRGPLTSVTSPAAGELAWSMLPEGSSGAPLPAGVCRSVGKGRVVYLAAALDAALWSYAYPYQRVLLARAIEWAARVPPPVRVSAPLCVQATVFTQGDRVVVHLFNGVNTSAHHGQPGTDVPLREEVLPIHDVRVRFARGAPRRCWLQPEGKELPVRQAGAHWEVMVPRLDVHSMVVAVP